MVKHIWTILCKESKIDAATNNISIIDAYENLQFKLDTQDENYKKGAPIGVPINFELISLFFRDKKGETFEMEETVVVLDPKGEKLGEFPSKVQFQEEHDRMRNIVKFNMIALTVSGTYLFQVFTKKGSGNTSRRELISAIPVNISLTVNGSQI